jgi:hypothetical protein
MVIFSGAVFLLNITSLHSQILDSSIENQRITKIADFNGDLLSDTLISVKNNNSCYPFCIRWNSITNNSVGVTYFDYSVGDKYDVKVSTYDSNEDNIEDIALKFIKYKKNENSKWVIDEKFGVLLQGSRNLAYENTVTIKQIQGVYNDNYVMFDLATLYGESVLISNSNIRIYPLKNSQSISTKGKYSPDKNALVKCKIFPNPSNNLLNIEVENVPSGRYSLKIVNNLGTELKNENININSNIVNYQIDINTMVTGTSSLILMKGDEIVHVSSFVISK